MPTSDTYAFGQKAKTCAKTKEFYPVGRGGAPAAPPGSANVHVQILLVQKGMCLNRVKEYNWAKLSYLLL